MAPSAETVASAALPGLGELTTGYMRGIPMIAVDAGIFLAQGLVVLVMSLIVASFPIVSIGRLRIVQAITGR